MYKAEGGKNDFHGYKKLQIKEDFTQNHLEKQRDIHSEVPKLEPLATGVCRLTMPLAIWIGWSLFACMRRYRFALRMRVCSVCKGDSDEIVVGMMHITPGCAGLC